MNRRFLLESLLKKPRLPSAFQEVEWIGSSGTQYIDTTFIWNSNSKCEIECSFDSQVLSQQRMGITGNISARCAFGVNNGIEATFVIGYNGTLTFGNITSNKHIFTLDYQNKQYGVDNSLVSVALSYAGDNSPFGLFRRYSSTTGSYEEFNISKAKLYSAKFYDNSVLVRNFVPCYRKADNEIGLYDLVNGVFYTNAGIGTFTKGGNV